jgi:hypothetical protein
MHQQLLYHYSVDESCFTEVLSQYRPVSSTLTFQAEAKRRRYILEFTNLDSFCRFLNNPACSSGNKVGKEEARPRGRPYTPILLVDNDGVRKGSERWGIPAHRVVLRTLWKVAANTGKNTKKRKSDNPNESRNFKFYMEILFLESRTLSSTQAIFHRQPVKVHHSVGSTRADSSTSHIYSTDARESMKAFLIQHNLDARGIAALISGTRTEELTSTEADEFTKEVSAILSRIDSWRSTGEASLAQEQIVLVSEPPRANSHNTSCSTAKSARTKDSQNNDEGEDEEEPPQQQGPKRKRPTTPFLEALDDVGAGLEEEKDGGFYEKGKQQKKKKLASDLGPRTLFQDPSDEAIQQLVALCISEKRDYDGFLRIIQQSKNYKLLLRVAQNHKEYVHIFATYKHLLHDKLTDCKT